MAIKNAPGGFLKTLGKLPKGATFATQARGRFDLALLFSTRKKDLESQFDRWAARLNPAGMLWVAWPKKASGKPTDLAFNVVQGISLDAGLVDTKICAIDEDWSSLRFVRRVNDRRKEQK